MLSINKKIGFQSVAFSPAYYKQAIKNYQQGNFRDLIALMEKAEIDSHVAGCLMGRRAGFLKEWRLTEASDARADVAVKEFVEAVLMRINMRELFEDVQEARLKKYSVIDLSWEVVEGRQVITQAKKVPQKYFRYDDDGILRLDFGGKDLREIPEDGALICESNRDPILLPVLRDFILKEFGLESWASFLETFGEAFIIGRYPAGADENFKTELENGVNTLASSSRGIMPEGSNIEIIETKRNTGDHQRPMPSLVPAECKWERIRKPTKSSVKSLSATSTILKSRFHAWCACSGGATLRMDNRRSSRWTRASRST